MSDNPTTSDLINALINRGAVVIVEDGRLTKFWSAPGSVIVIVPDARLDREPDPDSHGSDE